MLGLKTQESKKFNRFWQLIQEAAGKYNCTFFGFAGEGRDFITDEMEREDFSGWLVPSEDAAAFETLWAEPLESTEKLEKAFPTARFVFAIWKKRDEDVSVEFREF